VRGIVVTAADESAAVGTEGKRSHGLTVLSVPKQFAVIHTPQTNAAFRPQDRAARATLMIEWTGMWLARSCLPQSGRAISAGRNGTLLHHLSNRRQSAAPDVLSLRRNAAAFAAKNNGLLS
jgi:hypothetical protein